MPFATRKPDACINISKTKYAPFVVECGFTESYSAIHSDAVAWLTQTSGAVCAVLLVKLTEIKTDLVPPPLSVDEWAEDDNSPQEANQDDPAYEHLRKSTVAEEWVGPLEGFAELWRGDGAGGVKRDGERVTLLPRPSGGLKRITITRADIMGSRAAPGDERATWDLDMGVYCEMLMDAVKKMAFQRRVRYLKVTQAKEVENGEKQA